MANPPKRVYWDACTWIALIQREKIQLASGQIEDRETMCRMVIEAAKNGSIEILTSTFCLAEVCRHLDKERTSDKLAEFFENDYILLTNVDRLVAERARALMITGYSKIKPPDAVHLATAAVSPRLEEMHTFDARLLAIDGLIDKADGAKLKICKPDPGAPPAPLLEAMRRGKPVDPPP
jgi:predicted nucleic acid-binding protein